MIGFMQGRLTPPVDGKIQSFPWNGWRAEFEIAQKLNLQLMEWTLDYDNIYINPLMLPDGRKEIIQLSKIHGIEITSLTADFIMQSPSWKSSDIVLSNFNKAMIIDVAICFKEINGKIIVVPLVDTSSIKNNEEEKAVLDLFMELAEIFDPLGIQIAFESDFEPKRLKKFIGHFSGTKNVGINYDMGNSASYGFNPIEEFYEYGDSIINVHIKDRKFRGPTVRLGDGDVDFPEVFESFMKIGYRGNYILQTARSIPGEDVNMLSRNLEFINQWI